MTTPNPSTIETASRWGLVALLVANAALATGPMFVRLVDVGPITAAFWRLALGAPVLALLAVAFGSGKPVRVTPALALVIAASGVLFAADLACYHLGIVRTKLANATLFGNTASLIFPIWAFAVARVWPSRREGGALVLAALGGALLLGRSYELSPQHLAGDLLSLGAGVLYTAYFIAIARARASLAPLPLLALSTAASALPLLGLAWLWDERIWPGDWRPLLALAVVSQIVGQGLMTAALGRVRPSVIGVALLTQPVVAAGIGVALFGEALATLDLVGAALVAGALLLVAMKGRLVAPPASPLRRQGPTA